MWHSEGLTVRWWAGKKNFNMAYITPVPAQQTAKEYVEKTAGQWQGKLWLGGHSKGGNLAVYAGIHAEENVRGTDSNEFIPMMVRA